jgi:hypothetical protein
MEPGLESLLAHRIALPKPRTGKYSFYRNQSEMNDRNAAAARSTVGEAIDACSPACAVVTRSPAKRRLFNRTVGHPVNRTVGHPDMDAQMQHVGGAPGFVLGLMDAVLRSRRLSHSDPRVTITILEK